MHAADLWEQWGLPEQLDEVRVLDVGCWEGRMCVEALNRGAELVVGVDLCTCPELERRVAMNPGFSFVQADATSETMLALGRFDLVICAGVLYHTPHPVMLLNRLAACCDSDGLIMLETLIDDSYEQGDHVLTMPAGIEYQDESIWFVPTLAALRRLVTRAGLHQTEGPTRVHPPGNRASLRLRPNVRGAAFAALAPRRVGRLTLDGGTR